MKYNECEWSLAKKKLDFSSFLNMTEPYIF